MNGQGFQLIFVTVGVSYNKKLEGANKYWIVIKLVDIKIMSHWQMVIEGRNLHTLKLKYVYMFAWIGCAVCLINVSNGLPHQSPQTQVFGLLILFDALTGIGSVISLETGMKYV